MCVGTDRCLLFLSVSNYFHGTCWWKWGVRRATSLLGSVHVCGFLPDRASGLVRRDGEREGLFFLPIFLFSSLSRVVRACIRRSAPRGLIDLSWEASSCAVRWVPSAHSLTEARKLDAYVAQVASLRRPCRAYKGHNLWDVGTPTCGGSEEGWKARQSKARAFCRLTGRVAVSGADCTSSSRPGQIADDKWP